VLYVRGTNRLMHGYVHDDEYAHGIYFLERCDGDHPNKSAFLTIGPGAFGEGTDTHDRNSFCVEWRADGMRLAEKALETDRTCSARSCRATSHSTRRTSTSYDTSPITSRPTTLASPHSRPVSSTNNCRRRCPSTDIFRWRSTDNFRWRLTKRKPRRETRLGDEGAVRRSDRGVCLRSRVLDRWVDLTDAVSQIGVAQEGVNKLFYRRMHVRWSFPRVQRSHDRSVGNIRSGRTPFQRSYARQLPPGRAGARG
jgi:hypothetical protein